MPRCRGPKVLRRNHVTIVGHKMDEMRVYLDHYQAEQFGLYWRHYPQIGLNKGLFYNLLLYDDLTLSADSLYPDECRRSRWAGAFGRFMDIGKINLISSGDRETMEASINAVFSRKLDGLSLPDFEDVFNYDFCARNAVPLCLSRRRKHDIGRIMGLATEALHTPNLAEGALQALDREAAVAEWVLDLEIPALIARSEKMREDIFRDMPHLVAERGDGSVDVDFTTLLAASKRSELQDSIFITPDELVLVFEDADQIREIAQVLRDLASRVSSRAEAVDEVKAMRESLDARLGKSDLIFAGLNVGLSWVPFSSLGTTPTQLAVNRYIKGQFNWMLFLSTTNKQIRKASSSPL